LINFTIARNSRSADRTINVFWQIPLSDDVQINNGGTLFRGDLLLITTGNGTLPPSIVRVNPKPPFNDTIILNNFYGRQFNSLNDAKVHPQSRAIFFTDTTYVYRIVGSFAT
jgi:gluconolactonase